MLFLSDHVFNSLTPPFKNVGLKLHRMKKPLMRLQLNYSVIVLSMREDSVVSVQHEASVILIGVILFKNYMQNKAILELQGVCR